MVGFPFVADGERHARWHALAVADLSRAGAAGRYDGGEAMKPREGTMDDRDDDANLSGWGTPPRDFRPSWWAMAPGR